MKKNVKLESKRNDQDKMLPSFFSGIPTKAPRDQQSKELRQPKVESNNGPVFFGDCVFHHPAPHSSMLKSRFTAITTKKSTDSLWDNLYKKEEPIHRIITPQKPIRLLKNPSLVVDSLPHRAPGTRIIGGHLHTRRPTEFGTSESILKGEMIREKLCTIPVDPSLRN
ncbi:UNVERIFIED_CONTAM: hypothetical protein PYX00_005285 [Menopon gallinae]|uniref:Uncharacterized protein n=1 Tax=Menopon gallinae TaxID=328185 RepID=A0AAW2HRE4_9NEOP